MSQVARHSVDVELARRRYAGACEDLPQFLQATYGVLANLTRLSAKALDVALLGSAVGSPTAEIAHALRIAARAQAGMFLCVQGTGVFRLDDNDPLMSWSGSVDESQANAFRWIRGFLLASLLRDRDLMGGMCKVPSEVLRKSSTRDPEYRYLLVDALQLYWNDKDAGPQVLAAMNATEPSREDVRKPDWALHLDVPLIRQLYYLVRSDEDFEKGLETSLSLHRKYWGAKSRRNDWDGFLAIDQMGLCALAFDSGMPFGVESEYCPLDLVKGIG